MTASWLVQMGWRDAVVLEGGVAGHSLETGMPAPPLLDSNEGASGVHRPGCACGGTQARVRPGSWTYR